MIFSDKRGVLDVTLSYTNLYQVIPSSRTNTREYTWHILNSQMIIDVKPCQTVQLVANEEPTKVSISKHGLVKQKRVFAGYTIQLVDVKSSTWISKQHQTTGETGDGLCSLIAPSRISPSQWNLMTTMTASRPWKPWNRFRKRHRTARPSVVAKRGGKSTKFQQFGGWEAWKFKI